jgi:glycosyltransferase involved in cell wall biosynthesis
MRIIHLEASTGWGGQEIRILSEAKGMRQRGHEIFFVVEKGACLGKKARDEGFIVHELSFKKHHWPIAFFHLIYLFCNYRIDLVNTHSSRDAWVGGMAARFARRAILRTRHLSTPIKKGWNSRWLYQKLADFVVTTCAKIVPMVCEQSGKSPSYCRSVPTGMDPLLVQFGLDEPKRFRKKMGVAADDFLVGTVCMVRSWKGIEDFLQTAHLLREEKHIRWVIIGGGHLESYQKKATQMQLDSLVTFTGHLESPFGAIASLDAFVLLSTNHEGVSQASLQAAFLARPLITTPTGGLKEVCIPNVTGLQVPIFSPKEVANAVLELKKNPLLCERLGKSAKEHVEKHFMFADMLDQMEEIYKELCP